MGINTMNSLKPLKKNWAVAEISIKYKIKKRTGLKITGTIDAYKVVYSMWDKELITLQEQFCVLFLSPSNEVIGFRQISTGSLSSTVIDTKLVFSLALSCRANSIIIAHNHPSGQMQASKNDHLITRKIKLGCELLDIDLLDHIILSPWNSYFSFAEEGIL